MQAFRCMGQAFRGQLTMYDAGVSMDGIYRCFDTWRRRYHHGVFVSMRGVEVSTGSWRP